MSADEIVIYNDEEKAFVNEATDVRLFISNDNLTFKIEEIEENGDEVLDTEGNNEEVPDVTDIDNEATSTENQNEPERLTL
jgi:hypothetical protein